MNFLRLEMAENVKIKAFYKKSNVFLNLEPYDKTWLQYKWKEELLKRS